MLLTQDRSQKLDRVFLPHQLGLQAFLGETALHIAVAKDDIKMVELLIRSGCDVNPKKCIGAFFRDWMYFGGFIMGAAVRFASIDMCKLLLANGV